MGIDDKIKDGVAIDGALEDAGRQFGLFAKGFIGILDNLSARMTPVVENMLIAMAEAWARRVVEKNT